MNNNYMTDQRDSAHHWPYGYDIDIPFNGNRAERALLVVSMVLATEDQPDFEALANMLTKEMGRVSATGWVKRMESVTEYWPGNAVGEMTQREYQAQVAHEMMSALLTKGTTGHKQR